MRNLPPVTRNILLTTFLCYFAAAVLSRYGVDCTALFGLHYVTASKFYVWQPVTYMFMHANFSHIFCNMFAVLMFAPALEERWGSRRFLLYYIVTGVGAAIVQEAVWAVQLQPVLSSYEWDMARSVASRVVTIGASGAVFGILFAFAWLFPDVRMFILFIPVPIRARVMVIAYAVIELLAGFSPLPGDNVAHFAHLGGMVFGWLLILWWRRKQYDGFEKAPMDNSAFRQWWRRLRWKMQDRCPQWLRGRFPRIRKDKSKDYSDYHYHGSVK